MTKNTSRINIRHTGGKLSSRAKNTIWVKLLGRNGGVFLGMPAAGRTAAE
jgi:hypothetical protein